MTRNEARTEDAWRSFDRWATLIVPVLMALPALYLWQTGYGAGAAGCCAASAASAAAVVAPVVTAPVTASVTPAPTVTVPSMPPVASTPVASTPVASSPVGSTPVVDCSALVSGVTVPFAVANARLTTAGRAALDRAVTCLGSGLFEVAGHTDADGSQEDNQRLSVARARAAVRFLVSRGVAESSLSAAGYGETQPVADNQTAEGKARNRRIAFIPR